MHVHAVRKRWFRGAWRAADGPCCSTAPEMDQDYERRLLRQINHQNLPAETRLAKVRKLGEQQMLAA